MKKGHEPTYDEKCLELARHFLTDEPLTDEQRKRYETDLAVHIQQAVEDWLSTP